MIPEPDDLTSATTYATNAAGGFISQLRLLPGPYAVPILRQFLDDLAQRWLDEPEGAIVQAVKEALDTAARPDGW